MRNVTALAVVIYDLMMILDSGLLFGPPCIFEERLLTGIDGGE